MVADDMISNNYLGNFVTAMFYKLQESVCNKENKAGIYQINWKDCEKIYIGKTKRNLETRVKEHFRNIKNGEIEKSAIAAHIWKEKKCNGS